MDKLIKKIRKGYIKDSDPIIRRNGKEITLNTDGKLLSPDFISSGFEKISNVE
jgi:hypothetical protein